MLVVPAQTTKIFQELSSAGSTDLGTDISLARLPPNKLSLDGTVRDNSGLGKYDAARLDPQTDSECPVQTARSEHTSEVPEQFVAADCVISLKDVSMADPERQRFDASTPDFEKGLYTRLQESKEAFPSDPRRRARRRGHVLVQFGFEAQSDFDHALNNISGSLGKNLMGGHP